VEISSAQFGYEKGPLLPTSKTCFTSIWVTDRGAVCVIHSLVCRPEFTKQPGNSIVTVTLLSILGSCWKRWGSTSFVCKLTKRRSD